MKITDKNTNSKLSYSVEVIVTMKTVPKNIYDHQMNCAICIKRLK